MRAGVAAIREQPHEDVFTPGADGTRLHARLYRVPHAHATVILCHGYHSHAEHDFSAQFPALYASGGCNLLLIDERAHGLSEGKCLTFGQLERYDIAQWVHWVREHSRVQRPIALYGVSMGAASVLLAAQLPELKGELACVVADCGYSSFELEITDAVRHGTNAPCWLQKPLARICVRILRRNGLDFDAVDTTPGMAALDIPILFFHGDADTFVPHHSERNTTASATSPPAAAQVIPAALRRHPRRGARHVRAGRPRALPARAAGLPVAQYELPLGRARQTAQMSARAEGSAKQQRIFHAAVLMRCDSPGA